MFTINNPSEWRLWDECPEGVAYMTWQVERGEHLGTVHLQGYLELEASQYLSFLLTNVSARGHFEVRRGTQEEAINYCRKEETRQAGPYELGRKAISKQGERVDILAFRDAIRTGRRAAQLWTDFPRCMAKFPRMYLELKSTIRPVRERDLAVTLLYGKTGRGKTRLVYSNWEHKDEFWRWSVPNTTVWFDGYDGHKLCLLDDFAGKSSKMSLVMLLQVLDRYPIMLPVKGSFVWWCPDHIAITTNIHPRDWYNYVGREEQYKALVRRVTEVLSFDVKKEDGGWEPFPEGPKFWYDDLLYPEPPTVDLRCNEELIDGLDFVNRCLRRDELETICPLCEDDSEIPTTYSVVQEFAYCEKHSF